MTMVKDNDIRAEFVATQLYDGYPDYSIKKLGRFYRGYCSDLLSMDSASRTVELSRDGIRQMLPEGLFFREDYLREAKSEEEEKRRIEFLKQKKNECSIFFEAFDTMFFRQEVAAQVQIDATEEQKELLALSELFAIDVRQIRNPLVKKLSMLLFDADTVKGNLRLIAFCVRSILQEKISCRILTRVPEASPSMCYHCLRIDVYIDGLSSKEYNDKMEEYEELFQFLEMWFMPYDCELEYCIKDIHQPFVLGEQLTLDYNTQLF